MLYQEKKKLKAVGTKRSFVLNAICTRAIELKVNLEQWLRPTIFQRYKYLELQVLAVVTMFVEITPVILKN